MAQIYQKFWNQIVVVTGLYNYNMGSMEVDGKVVTISTRRTLPNTPRATYLCSTSLNHTQKKYLQGPYNRKSTYKDLFVASAFQ